MEIYFEKRETYIKEKKRQTKPQRNTKNKIKQVQKQGNTHTHTKEPKTEPHKTKSKKTTSQIEELKNEIKELQSN